MRSRPAATAARYALRAFPSDDPLIPRVPASDAHQCVIEQVIARFKTWRIMHTDYRRSIETFATTISAVIGLHFYRMV
jgi:hypothetical protein